MQFSQLGFRDRNQSVSLIFEYCRYLTVRKHPISTYAFLCRNQYVLEGHFSVPLEIAIKQQIQRDTKVSLKRELRYIEAF